MRIAVRAGRVFTPEDLAAIGVRLVIGDPLLARTLRDADIEHAAAIVMTGEDDLTNLNIALAANEIRRLALVHLQLRIGRHNQQGSVDRGFERVVGEMLMDPGKDHQPTLHENGGMHITGLHQMVPTGDRGQVSVRKHPAGNERPESPPRFAPSAANR